MKLYTNQTAKVKTDTFSREFNIQRGTKQGDPLSSLLFNSLSESIFRKLLPEWARRGCGIHLQAWSDDTLTNLRFADDVILFATSLSQLTQMLREIAGEAKKTGLELHPDKTKILHNQPFRRPRQTPEHTYIGNMKIEMLPHSDSQKYLGKKFSFHQQAETEVENRIAAAWRKFHLLKRELTTKSYSLNSRIRLFQGTVTPTVLYACTSWTLTVELENRLKRTQRQMLRMILGSPRRHHGPTHIEPNSSNNTNNDSTSPTTDSTTRQPQQTQLAADTYNNTDADSTGPDSDDDDVTSEPPDIPAPNENPQSEDDDMIEAWVDWIRRCTHDVEQRLANLHIPDWISIQRSRKWTWASRIANDTRNKWSLKALLWDPTLDPRYSARRRQARPRRRWSDDIRQHARHHDNDDDDDDREPQLGTDRSDRVWMTLARDADLWYEMEDEFVRRNV